MKKGQRSFQANRSGQLLIVAALAVAILISATTIYVYELSTETNTTHNFSINNFVLALKQTTKNAMISSLANISNGGERAELTFNLNELTHALRSLNQFGTCNLTFAALNDFGYGNGTKLSWNTSDNGMSSAYANFTLNVYGLEETVTIDYAINITTSITVKGHCTSLTGNEKRVNLTCYVYNEGMPGLTKTMSLFYENLGSWYPVDASNDLSVTDYGNGTYSMSFIVNISATSFPVSARLYDLREIFVQANTTCSET
jgi:hypothetical protein